jgi:molybdopterin synthase catalytic subunit
VAAITRDTLDGASLLRACGRPDCGAQVLFLGTTRDHHGGRQVRELAYEAYEPMALAALEAIERAVLDRFEVRHCAIVHRLGVVPVGEASVAVAVASAHRAAAFDAGRWAMDELKRTVPIWKKERFEDGGEDWVAGTKLGG